jgi:type II secretory pathway pseudopilin PulG
MHPLLHRRRHGRDEGFALITTVLTLALLAAFSLVALHQTLQSTGLSRKDQDWVAALGAAQAGLDDYLAKLNDSTTEYWKYSSTPVMPPPSHLENPGMGKTPGGVLKWAPVPTAGGEASRGTFHYDVDTTEYAGKGTITVSSTGKVGKRSRTLKAQVRRSGFVDFLYFTDFETQDPLLYDTPAARDAAVTSCSAYYGTRAVWPDCEDPAFKQDVVDGPVHSNDTMFICSDNQFRDRVTTASPQIDATGNVVPTGGTYSRSNGCSSGTTGTTYKYPGDPVPRPRINMPSTNLGLKAETSAAATPRGCLFVGPTKIVISGSMLKVKSPWTKTASPGCPANETPFPIPANGVIYVDVVPGDGITGDDNSWPAGTTSPPKPTCPATGNNVNYPIPGEDRWTYPCKAGDVFIEQLDGDSANALAGRLTVAANNNVYVTNHIDYAGGTAGNSFLGLIAEQFVYVWHPTSNGTNLGLNPADPSSTPFLNARISAAVLSVNHAITVQNFKLGAHLGTLSVKGAMVQRFRGPVKWLAAGYDKNYSYDPRLHYDAPPKFLQPTTSSFVAVRTSEATPQYS